MNKAKFISFASVISEIQQSDVFMTVKARILETPKANLNGASVTEAFVDDVIANEERYVGLPLYADIHALKHGKYDRLGHLYDSKTGEFHSTQIGSFYQFEKEEFEGGSYLVGYARIPKRDKSLSKAIAELFADGALKFSFEIACVDYISNEDGTITIEASENNYLEGTAIVTFPACEDAVALEFVAQREADDTQRGDGEMADVEKLVAEETEATVEETTEEVVAETTEQAEEPETEIAASEEKTEEAGESEDNTEDENASCKKEKAEENAEVYVHESDVQEHTTYAYDTETGKDVSQTVRIETHVSEPVEGNLVEADEGTSIAEAGEDAPAGTSTDTQDNTQTETPAETTNTPAKTPDENENSGDSVADTKGADNDGDTDDIILPGENKRTAEEMFAELVNVIEGLKKEIAELKEQKLVAETKTVTAEINPFVDSIQSSGQYSLLQKETRKTNSYSLLGKA